MTIAEAPPPPLQMEAQPMVASLACSTPYSVPIILEPELPMGCPSATAPPCTLTVARSRSMSLALTSPTTEKASLISWNCTSLADTPAWFRARGTASEGAVVNSTGSLAASPNPRTRNSGVRLFSRAYFPEVMIIAEAPSFSLDALAAVTVPSLAKAGRSVRSLSRFMPLNSSSTPTTESALPRLPLIVTGDTSPSNKPACQALVALS
mmetsp:Transcript_14970/g.30045  ORF Transcript_14970/g.30045 Transcript_14970/m.30045 type:complete len:208 (-) Transcript_14970:703-1326(-)